MRAMAFFAALGIDLKAPAGQTLFFNDKLGLLFVKASLANLDMIERAIQTLNQVAPQIHIKTRFVEIEQDDNKQLGFDWYLGQFNMGGNNNVVGQAGTGAVPQGNPILNPVNGRSVPSVGDLTSGLGYVNNVNNVATITGIMTQPNFQVVLHALQQRYGAETLAEPEVTTTSGRQTEMRATKILTIITGVDANTSSSSTGGTGGTGGTGTSLSTVTYNTSPLETGPILDVVPYLLADGYTINMALIPSLTDFLGYGQVPSLTIASSTTGQNIGYVQVLPVLPQFAIRQVVTTVNVWDNQTVVLGGLINSTINSENDKVPMIGELPLIGRLFQSQSKTSIKKNLMIFVTPTVVDPAGNRVHSDNDLPFTQTAVPPQPLGAGKATETVRPVSLSELKPQQ